MMIYIKTAILATIIAIGCVLIYLFLHMEHVEPTSSSNQPEMGDLQDEKVLSELKRKIDRGDYLEVRQTLDKERQQATPERTQEIYFLLGLTYIREAQEKTVGTALPYYKLAFTNFDKMSILDKQYDVERAAIIKNIQTEIQALIKKESYADLPFYVSILEKWKAKKQINELSTSLEILINQELESKDWRAVQDISALLGRILPEGNLQKSLQGRFSKLVKATLDSNSLSHLNVYWNALLAFSPKPEEITDSYANYTVGRILAVIPKDKDNLPLTSQYLEFWEKIEKNERKRNLFAEKLVSIARDLWMRDRQEKKAIELIKLASTLPTPSGQLSFHTAVETNMAQIYASALKQDDIDDLPFILEAIKDFNLTTIHIFDKQQIIVHMHDAQYFYDNKKYREAKKKAAWVIQIDPSNVQAQRLLGLSHYSLAEYPQALTELTKLPFQDKETIEAVAVSTIIAGDQATGQQLLEKIARQHPLDSVILLRLGFGSLMNHNAAAAIYWFNQIPQKNNEVNAGLFLAAFEQKHWNEALAYFHTLTYPYDSIEGLRSIAILSLMALENNEQAEEMVQDLNKDHPAPDTTELSEPFKALKRERLDSIDHFYISGLYFKYIKHNDQKALENYERMQKFSPDALLERAKAYLEVKNYHDMISDLNRLLQLSNLSQNNVSNRKDALTLLAMAYEATGQSIEAMDAFKEYLNLDSKNNTMRRKFAKVLMNLGRYDLALEQLRSIERVQELDSTDQLTLLSCLVYTGQFDDANKQAEKWMTQVPPPPVTSQLQLARLLTITFNPGLFQKIFDNIPEMSTRSQLDNEEFFRLLLEMARYSEAADLAQKMGNELENTPTGLLLLANLNSQLSKENEVKTYVTKAVKSDPFLLLSEDFMRRYVNVQGILRDSIEAAKKNLHEYPTSLSWQIAYVRDMIYKAIEKSVASGAHNLHDSPELTEAHVILDKIANQTQGIPEVHLLRGEVFFLLDNNAYAEEAYKKALLLDPSYAEAYKHLGLIYAETKNFKEAIRVLKSALRYDPRDAEAWKKLAKADESVGNIIDAVSSMQNVVKYKPNDPSAYIYLANLLLQIKNPEDAKIALEHSLTLSPNNIIALKLLYTTLNDPNLRFDTKNAKVLKAKQQETLNKIRILDPKEAETLRLQFTPKKSP